MVSSALGGENIGEVIHGRERFPINVRHPREYRDSLERALPIVTERGRDLRTAVTEMRQAVRDHVKLPPDFSIAWSQSRSRWPAASG